MMKDIYADFGGLSIYDLERITKDTTLNLYTKIQLLALTKSKDELKELGRSQYRSLVHQRGSTFNPYDTQLIKPNLESMNQLGLLKPSNDFLVFLPYSWIIQFGFTLAKPYISRDDEPLYIIDNPVRKDKIFKIPTISSASWKGNLRWTWMKTYLETIKDMRDEDFAAERLRQMLLFGSEKGMDEKFSKGWSGYLDNLRPSAVTQYHHLIGKNFGKDDRLIHFKGRLHFYPTFFNKIDLIVINPHDRKTKTGKNPIYVECVPAGAQGVFSLLYTPYDLFGKKDASIESEILIDLHHSCAAIKEMFLTYGFSAKKNSGFGTSTDSLQDGELLVRYKLNEFFEKKKGMEGIWSFKFKSLSELASCISGDTSR
ncbi:MAG: CRISPR-associated protein [Candidatus Methanoperedens sp.]|nr:CRISPR-associated protein [Candidatus Methanoperedens sp.]